MGLVLEAVLLQAWFVMVLIVGHEAVIVVKGSHRYLNSLLSEYVYGFFKFYILCHNDLYLS